ncbi:MAG: ferrochelatase, partial [Chlamydiia bacterium]
MPLIWMGEKLERALLLVNFGGPRDLQELGPFMEELLCDQDVIQTKWPAAIHRLLFKRIARKRVARIHEEYERMGGGSPIFGDTERLAMQGSRTLQRPCLTFHRYLPATHQDSLRALEEIADQVDVIDVLPLFPQFSFTTTGSCARWFKRRASCSLLKKLAWVRSYEDHEEFIGAYQEQVARFLATCSHVPEKTILLFSAHGLPVRYVHEGDPYPEQCRRSVKAIADAFPGTTPLLAFQSRFGREEWLRPYTVELAGELRGLYPQHDLVLVIPVAFTSDHLETLVEIEREILPVLREGGFRA